MREILFRAKTVKNVHWVWGDLFHAGTEPSDGEFAISYWDDEDGWMNENVQPGTIGQFTELTDKNGKRIFEGDILRSPSGNIVAVEFGYKEHIVKHGRPYITDSFACYGWIARNVKSGITDFFDNEFAAGEVVGNIHDNPELIKQR